MYIVTLIAPVGFEPTFLWLKAKDPKPLDEGAKPCFRFNEDYTEPRCRDKDSNLGPQKVLGGYSPTPYQTQAPLRGGWLGLSNAPLASMRHGAQPNTSTKQHSYART